MEEEKTYVLEYYKGEPGESYHKVKALLNSQLDFRFERDVWCPKPGFIITCREDVLQPLKEMFPWIIDIKPYQPVYLELVKDYK